MNITLSLLIYNPIEAVSLILLCDVITGNDTKLNLKDVLTIYTFGAINFVIQYIPNLFPIGVTCLFFRIVNEFVLIPISIGYFYRKFNNLTVRQSIVAQMINMTFALCINLILCTLFKFDCMIVNKNSLHEFIINMVIYSCQIIGYLIIKKRTKHYEELFKSNRKQVR